MILHTEWTLDSAVLAPIWDAWFCPLVDLLATRFNQTSNLPFSSARPCSLGSGRPLYSMAGSSGLHLSSTPHSVKGTLERQEGASHTHPSCPKVASSTLVPRFAASLPCTSPQAPPSPQGPSSAQVRNRTCQSRASRPSCLH